MAMRDRRCLLAAGLPVDLPVGRSAPELEVPSSSAWRGAVKGPAGVRDAQPIRQSAAGAAAPFRSTAAARGGESRGGILPSLALGTASKPCLSFFFPPCLREQEAQALATGGRTGLERRLGPQSGAAGASTSTGFAAPQLAGRKRVVPTQLGAPGSGTGGVTPLPPAAAAPNMPPPAKRPNQQQERPAAAAAAVAAAPAPPSGPGPLSMPFEVPADLSVPLGGRPAPLTEPEGTPGPTVVLEARNGNGGCHVAVSCGGQTLWEERLGTRVTAAAGNLSFSAVATEDSTLLVFSAQGRRLLPPLATHGPGLLLHAQPDTWQLQCVSAGGELRRWDLQQRRCSARCSVLPVLSALAPGERLLRAGITRRAGHPVLPHDILFRHT